jgi:hypothetical protein
LLPTKETRTDSLPADFAEVQRRLQHLNASMKGPLEHKITNGVVTELHLPGDLLEDLSPVTGLRGLIRLNCESREWGKGKLRSLAPLQGLRLEELNVNSNPQITDLTPLSGMPLRVLNCYKTGVTDLRPLANAPLEWLNLGSCGKVRDLTPLQGMLLTWLSLQECGQVRDLTPLQGMPLTSLYVADCGNVRDLTPLQGMNLTEIYLTPKHVKKGMEVLRQMKNLKIIGIGWETRWSANDFWKKYDSGEFNK